MKYTKDTKDSLNFANYALKQIKVYIVALCIVILSVIPISVLAAQKLSIGLLYDGTTGNGVIETSLLQEEVTNILEPDYKVTFTSAEGQWTAEGVEQRLSELLNNKGIDIVIPMGLVGSHIAGHMPNLNKPVVATFVPDPSLQRIPLNKQQSSGKHNYTYVSDLQNVEESIKQVLAVLPSNNIALFVDELIIKGIPELVTNRTLLGNKPVKLIQVSNSLNKSIQQIPANTDTLLVAPLHRFNKQQIKQFAQQLISRKVHSVSFAGKNEVNLGLLMAAGAQAEDDLRMARRIALNIFSITSGDKAADLPVLLEQGERISYNVDTAEALNFELPWQLQLTSEAIYSDYNGTALDLNTIIDRALNHTINYQLEQLNTNISQQDYLLARSTWWPQLSLGAQYSEKDQDISSAASPEKSTDASLSINQLIYSESADSAVDIAKLNRLSQKEVLSISMLDTISNASQAYLSILQAQALEAVQRANLQASLQNLQLAKNRVKLGAVNPTDVTRWQSQIATDKQNLLSAKADEQNAIINLQSLLNQPILNTQRIDRSAQQELIARLTHEKMQAIFDSPKQYQLLKKWTVEQGMADAPEIKQADIITAINSRELKSARRSRFIPDINANINYNDNIDRSGIGAADADLITPDTNWSAGVSASLPLFTGGKNKAKIAKARMALKQSRLQKKLVENNVRLSIWNAINQLSASYPSIRLSRAAEQAADRSLRSVRDQYSSGSISITDLIDAQNSALAAQLTAAQSEYAFLSDLVNLMRATSDFSGLTDPASMQRWLKEFSAYKANQL